MQPFCDVQDFASTDDGFEFLCRHHDGKNGRFYQGHGTTTTALDASIDKGSACLLHFDDKPSCGLYNESIFCGAQTRVRKGIHTQWEAPNETTAF